MGETRAPGARARATGQAPRRPPVRRPQGPTRALYPRPAPSWKEVGTRPRLSNNPVSTPTEVTIPALVNPGASRARPALEALSGAPGFELRQLAPPHLTAALREAVSRAVPRVLVAGGDGTVALAASVLADTPVA